jgi:hypothetical protein
MMYSFSVQVPVYGSIASSTYFVAVYIRQTASRAAGILPPACPAIGKGALRGLGHLSGCRVSKV